MTILRIIKRLCLYVLLLLAVTSCHEKKKQGNKTDNTTAEETTMQNGDFYRRYSGTIAGQSVVVHLQRIGNKITGSYYYTSQGKMISLYNMEDTTDDNSYLLTEVSLGNDDGNAYWLVQLDGESLKGKWTAADGRKEYPISLTEQYPEGSYRMLVKYYEETRTLIAEKEAPSASFSCSYVTPDVSVDRADADFIFSIVKKELGCDTVSNNMDACVRKAADAYLKDYRDGIADMDTSNLMSEMNNYSSDQSMRIGYNDNGMLVIEAFGSSYSGGAHGNYGSSYICADVKEHHIWKLEDILAIDSAVLETLLDVAARDYFGLGLNDKLEDRMLVEEVPVTDNFFISEKGISFIYNPYEIASFADGTVALFISYDKLRSLLTPAFINRMHLFRSSAGSAFLYKNYNGPFTTAGWYIV